MSRQKWKELKAFIEDDLKQTDVLMDSVGFKVKQELYDKMISMDKEVTCDHCGRTYESITEFQKDCFVASDGWEYGTFHNCLKDEGLSIHGY